MSFIRLGLQHPERLDPATRDELEQLVSSLQRWATKVIPVANIPEEDLSISAGQIVSGQVSTSRGGTGVDASGATNGQLLIGSTGVGFLLSTLTAGANITITNAAGSVTITAAGSGSGTGLTTTYTSAIASPPATPTSGDLWFPTNSVYVYRYSGSAWIPWGPAFALVDPLLTSWSWVNQGTTTIDTTNGGVFIEDLTAGSLQLRLRVKAVPSNPYTITTFWLPRFHADPTLFSGLCVGWRDSASGKCVIFLYRPNTGLMTFGVHKYTNSTTFSATYLDTYVIAAYGVWMRIRDDSTNRYCEWSSDGQHWDIIHQVGRTDFLTADQVLIGLNINTNSAGALLASYKET